MADVVASLAIKLEALGAEQAKRQVAGLGTEASRTERAVSALGRAMSLVASGFVVREFTRWLDTTTRLRGQLSLVAQSTTEVAEAQRALFRVAQETRTSLEDTTTLYVRIAQAAGDLGLNQEQIVRITRTVNQSLALSGTTAGQAAGSLLQLGQAFGGGIVRAEEFNSILEGNRALLAKVAEANGTSVAKLRQQVNDGLLSSRDFAAMVLRAEGTVNESFLRMPVTIEQAMTRVRNTLLSTLGTLNRDGAIAGIFVKVIEGAASAIEWLIGNIMKLGGAVAGMIGTVVRAIAESPLAETLFPGAAEAAANWASLENASSMRLYKQGEGVVAGTPVGTGGVRRSGDPRVGSGTSAPRRSAGPMQTFAEAIQQSFLADRVTRGQFALSQSGGILDGIRAPRMTAKSIAELVPITEAMQAFQQIEQILSNGLASALGNAIAAGFARGVQTHNWSEGFKALGATLLGGLGGMLQQIGTAALASMAWLAKIRTALLTWNPVLGTAAAIGMIALGGAMQGLAGRTTSQKGLPVGAGAGAVGSTAGTIIDRGVIGGPIAPFGGAAFGAPGTPGGVSVGNLVLLSPNDPTWQRQL
ncbi:MAG: tape measure protein, partial [Pseudomonadota bacterium]